LEIKQMNNARKIFLPLAAGLFFSPALMAADMDTPSTSRTVTNEMLSTAGSDDEVVGDVLAVTLGAEYAVDDIITLGFTGTSLDNGSLEVSITVAPGALSGITLGLLSSTASEAVYRVTEIVPGAATSTVGLTVPFAPIDTLIFDASLIGSVVTVTYDAMTGTGLALDTGGGKKRDTDYIETADQYASEVDPKFDGIIDVNEDREEFTDGVYDDATTDVTDTPANFMTTFVDQDIMWTGDFSWIFDTDEDTAGIQPATDVIIVTPGVGTCTDPAVTSITISYTCTDVTTANIEFDTSLNVDGPDDDLAVLPATTFSVTVTVNFTGYDGDDGSVEFTMSGGEWVLNGYQVLVPYMPYGANISQIQYLVNRGVQVGEVTVEWVDQFGNSGSLGVIGTLGAGMTMAVGQIIQNALPSAQQAQGRLALTITANVPANDAQSNHQYNVSGNRAYVLHSDNRDD
jgi:hypothetical protein